MNQARTNLLNAADREEFRRRIDSLRADQPAQWGSLDAARMLCHLGDQLRVVLADVTSKMRGGWVHRTVVKWAVLHLPLRPPRGRIKTVPEMLTTSPAEFEADRRDLLVLVDRVVESPVFAPHPVFGELTRDEWGRLAAIHFDHHLRQFGC